MALDLYRESLELCYMALELCHEAAKGRALIARHGSA